MLSLSQNIIILVLVLAAALLFTIWLGRLWPAGERYASEDLIGWQLNILGITYAVILGFMFYTVWTTFTSADLNTDLEASALRNVFRLAEGLPAPQRAQLELQSRAYADAVVEDDWPRMARGEVPERSHLINQDMWKTLMSVKAASGTELMAEDHALTELSTLTQYRRTRLLESTSRLPTIFWCVLLVGGLLTIVSVAMFGSRNPRLHAFQVLSITLLITLAMLAVADLNCPFRGWVHISDYAFQRARLNMREPSDTRNFPSGADRKGAERLLVHELVDEPIRIHTCQLGGGVELGDLRIG
jgi:hypothetical protein